MSSCRIRLPAYNYVDKEIQAMLRPFLIIHTIWFTPKYRIKDNLIHPNNFITYFLSLLGTMTFIFLLIYQLYLLYVEEISTNVFKLTYLTLNLEFFFSFSGFVTNCAVNVFKMNDNINLVLRLQDVHVFLNVTYLLKRFVFLNWIIVICSFGYSVINGAIANLVLNLSALNFVTCLSTICFEINFLNAISFIKFLSHTVELWNNRIQNLVDNGRENAEVYNNNMFNAYANILECYDLYRSSFEHMIVYHILEFFFHALVRFQMSFDLFNSSEAKEKHDFKTAWVFSSFLDIWIVKSLTLIISLSYYYEKFYTAIYNIQYSCSFILKQNCSDNERRLCKNVQRLHRASFNKIIVCRLFYIDACFPLKMLALLSNYVIVLLQFAFF